MYRGQRGHPAHSPPVTAMALSMGKSKHDLGSQSLPYEYLPKFQSEENMTCSNMLSAILIIEF